MPRITTQYTEWFSKNYPAIDKIKIWHGNIDAVATRIVCVFPPGTEEYNKAVLVQLEDGRIFDTRERGSKRGYSTNLNIDGSYGEHLRNTVLALHRLGVINKKDCDAIRKSMLAHEEERDVQYDRQGFQRIVDKYGGFEQAKRKLAGTVPSKDKKVVVQTTETSG